jgi:hypothetical protein
MSELIFDLIYTIDSFITGVLKVCAIIVILRILKNKKGAIKCLPK